MNEVVVAPGSAAIGAEPRVRCLPGVDPLDPAAVVAAARAIVGRARRDRSGGAARAPGSSTRCATPAMRVVRADAGRGADRDLEGVLPRGRRGGGRAAWRAPGRSRRARKRRRAPTWPSSARTGRGVVLKQDGLAAGKGVAVYDDVGLALDHVAVLPRRDAAPGRRSSSRSGCAGREASVIAICDGREAIALPASRDHKRLCDGDLGPNTGGMGAYSPLPGPRRRGRRGDPRHGPSADPRRARATRHAVRRLPVRGPDAHRRRPGAPRMQRPARRSRGAGDPAAAGRRARAGARRRRQARARRLRARMAGQRCRCCPGAAVGIVLAVGGLPRDAEARAADRGHRGRRGRGRARLPRRLDRPARRRLRHERRARAHGRRVAGRTCRRRGTPRRRAAEPDLVGRACSAATTSPRSLPPAPAVAVGAAP